jgi:hypothetical protein
VAAEHPGSFLRPSSEVDNRNADSSFIPEEKTNWNQSGSESVSTLQQRVKLHKVPSDICHYGKAAGLIEEIGQQVDRSLA